jgi:hypothetical protein
MWYYQLNDQQEGPCDSETIRDLIARRVLGGDSLVWKEGQNDRYRLADTELASLIPATVPPPIRTNVPPPVRLPSPVDLMGLIKPGDDRKTWLTYAVLGTAGAVTLAALMTSLAVLAASGGRGSTTSDSPSRVARRSELHEYYVDCPHCDGTGEIEMPISGKMYCSRCGGAGYISEWR